MKSDLDWTRLEAAVARAVESLRATAVENQSLRAEVARLRVELQGVGAAVRGAPERNDEVARRLALLEGEIEALLG